MFWQVRWSWRDTAQRTITPGAAYASLGGPNCPLFCASQMELMRNLVVALVFVTKPIFFRQNTLTYIVCPIVNQVNLS